MSNKKLLLITTKGCEGCKILDNLIRKALSTYGKDVDYEVKDKDSIDVKFLKDHHICDFPTTILYQDELIVFIFVGTKPVNVIKNYMTIHFDK